MTDLVMFMGQSNMAGRGEAEKAAPCPPEAGWEFRPVTEPGRLFPIREPFGLRENRPGGIDDKHKKTGGLAGAFSAEYYRLTGRRVLGVSASEGGTSTAQWIERLLPDALERFLAAEAFAARKGMRVERRLMLWCQGETDGDGGVSGGEYKERFLQIVEAMKNRGIQACGLIQIGHFNQAASPQGAGGVPAGELERRYEVIRRAQEEICLQTPGVFLAASFAGFGDQMKDSYHYFQSAYDQVGREAAGRFAAYTGI